MTTGTRRTLAVAIAGLLAQGASGLYADEVGELDWHRQNLGRFTSAVFDGRGGLNVVGEASTLASLNSKTGEIAWRQVLSPEDKILATSSSTSQTPSTATVSARGGIVRLWSPVDGSLLWETPLTSSSSSGASAETEGKALLGGGVAGNSAEAWVVSTDEGFVVALSSGGIHVLAMASGAVLAQWWCDPAREPDLAALVGSDVQVTFNSLRLVPGGGGKLLAGGWTSKAGGRSSGDAVAFVVADIDPSERLVTFKAANVGKIGVNPSAGITLAHAHGAQALSVVGLCKGGSSLVVFSPPSPASSSEGKAVETPLPTGVLGSTGKVSAMTGLAGTNGAVLELKQGDGGSVAVTLGGGVTGAASVLGSGDGSKEACSCPAGGAGGVCVLAGGVSPSGNVFVASVSQEGGETAGKVVVNVAQVTVEGNFGASPVDSFETAALMPSLGQGASGFIQSAFLEAAEGGTCVPGVSGACFRALLVNEDDSVVMVGNDDDGAPEWVREEALADVDQVVFVDSAKDELAILAATGQKVEHHVPGWQERLLLHRLELTTYIRRGLESTTGLRLPGSELLGEAADSSHSAFGLKKLAICTTKVGKTYALDMADGTVVWSIFRPSGMPANTSRVILHASRPKAALGYDPEVVMIAVGEKSTVVSSLDAITGRETSRNFLDFKVTSAVPLSVKDSEERSIIMLVDSESRVHSVPSSADAKASLLGLLPHLFYHDVSDEGLESFAVVPVVPDGGADGGADIALGSATVASIPFHPARSKVVATAYPDSRDRLPTPAHTLGDDSLLIKYINPRLFAFAAMSAAEPGSSEQPGGGAGALNGKGQDLTVTVVDYLSGRVLHRITHKGAAEPVHIQVTESWVVYSYWSAVSHRTEMSTLSLYEGMIDKYSLSPFNRPEWKEAFSSFESKVPIVLQKTFIFPLPVTALGITLSQHGITAKNILVCTGLGQVVSMDRRFLDPRRPQEEPTKAEKEEKLVQYTPFLPIVPTQVISYYKVIERVNRVLTEPTGLESTSLVLALGLDNFGARVAPSKTYDMLDPNFNYALLTVVLTAMAAAVAVSNRVAASKRLNEQWA